MRVKDGAAHSAFIDSRKTNEKVYIGKSDPHLFMAGVLTTFFFSTDETLMKSMVNLKNPWDFK